MNPITEQRCRVVLRLYRPTPIGQVLRNGKPIRILYRLFVVPFLGMRYSHCALVIDGIVYDYDVDGLMDFPVELDEQFRPDRIDIPCHFATPHLTIAQVNNPFSFWLNQKPGLLGYFMGFHCVSFCAQCLYILDQTGNVDELGLIASELSGMYLEASVTKR